MLPRHTLAWIRPAASRGLLERADAATRSARRHWLAKDWPFCVRRPDIGETLAEGAITLGLPLPPDQGKRRLKLVVDRADIARVSEPLSLQVIVARAPVRHRAWLDTLDRRARARGVPLRVYGSFAWQALTTWNYVTARSDLDLLIVPADLRALDAAIAFLTSAEGTIPLDGEVVFPDGDAVSWREWRDADRDARMLVKSNAGVALIAREALRARLEERVSA